MRFIITITDRGPDSASGLRISFVAHSGLSHPKLVSAPPDTIETSCVPTGPGSPPGCTVKVVPPACHATATALRCAYKVFAVAPVGAHTQSLELVMTALTSGRGRETAVAGVSSSVADPIAADNHASATLHVGTSPTKHGTGTHHRSGPAVVVGKTFKPRLGDWDGTADGFPASFELLREPSYPRLYKRPPYGFKDVVLFKPSSCPVNPHASFQTTEQAGVTPIATDGSFGLVSDGIPGGLTAARTTVLSSGFNIPTVPGSPGCKGTLRWHLHPVARRAVSDGVWALHFADGESSTFTVSDEGRLANNLILPTTISGACGGASGAVDLFVAPSGVASWSDPQQPGLKISLTFTGRKSASGHISVAASAMCTSPVDVTMIASLSKRAA